jgi:hypothetical protein
MKAGKLTPDQKFWVVLVVFVLLLTALLLLSEKVFQ